MATEFVRKLGPDCAPGAWLYLLLVLEYCAKHYDPQTGRKLPKKFFDGAYFNKRATVIDDKVRDFFVNLIAFHGFLVNGVIVVPKEAIK